MLARIAVLAPVCKRCKRGSGVFFHVGGDRLPLWQA